MEKWHLILLLALLGAMCHTPPAPVQAATTLELYGTFEAIGVIVNLGAGDDPDSWKSILTKKGLNCEIVLTGMAEYPEVVEVWVRHLREVFAQL